MFVIYFKHCELIVPRVGYYDDVEAEWGTRFRSHYGQGESFYYYVYPIHWLTGLDNRVYGHWPTGSAPRT